MESYLEIFFTWLLRTSWQASVLVLIVLAIQWAFRNHLSARWRHALWLVVLVRLAVPFSPESPVSIFNIAAIGIGVADTTREMAVDTDPAIASADDAEAAIGGQFENPDFYGWGTPPAWQYDPAREPSAYMYENRRAEPVPARDTRPVLSTANSLPLVLMGIWIAGVLVLGTRILIQNARFNRRLRIATPVTDAGVLSVLDECRSALGLRASIRLLETDAVRSPAVCGILRPRILVPAGITRSFDARELRCVFLHELAHVKRRDVAAHWLATVLKTLHWFNPILWYGFQRMAADRELACDELALSHAPDNENRPYGATIIRLLERAPRSTALPGMVGILEERRQMTRRITMIARFRKHPRWSVTATLLLVALGVIGLTDARTGGAGEDALPEAGPDLTGVIRDEAGEPLAGARIFINTASPKQGPGVLCPSCYPDCAKETRSDAEGRFTIESLDPSLVFEVLVAATGFQPEFVADVDPSAEPLEVPLRPVHEGETPNHRVRGRVLDEYGHPVSGAVVRINGMTRNDRTWYGRYEGIDALAISDERGEFVIHSRDPFERAGFTIEARGLARRVFPLMASGDTVHEFTLTEGVSVSGRVMKDGQPLAGVEVGMSGAAQGFDVAGGNFSVGTDEDGRFLFENLPPQREYLVYGMMDSLGELGAIPVQRVLLDETMSVFGSMLYPITTPREVRALDDGTLDMGTLMVEPGHRLAGRIHLTDGNPVPEGTRVLLGRPDGWDRLETTTAGDGLFHFAGVPEEPITLSIRIEGYHLSSRNASVNPQSRSQLLGMIQADKTDLVIEFEPGENPDPVYRDSSGLRETPLRGAESPTETVLLTGGPGGTVLRPDGTPAAGATVYLIPAGVDGVQVQGESVEPGQGVGTRKTIANTEGRFSFSSEQDAFGVMVMDESGYGEARMEELNDGPIRLEAWARVEGQLLVGTEPAGDESIWLGVAHLPYEHHPRQLHILQLYLRTTTADDGTFVFERVPPIHLQAAHTLDIRDGRARVVPMTQTTRFTAAPGETRRLVLGGAGRTVIGRLSVNGYDGEIDWRAHSHFLESMPSTPPVVAAPIALYREFREALASATTDEDREAIQAEYELRREEMNERVREFYATEEGRRYHFSKRQFVLNVSQDGSFRIEDVPGGHYRLVVRIGEGLTEGEPNLTGILPMITMGTEVEIPESPEEPTREPYDLGVIEIQVPAR